jgi:hypothetical protein
VDLRVSRNAACRGWLEETLMAMEAEGLLDGIRERSPPHYHVALFPEAYMAHIAPILEAERSAERAGVLTERLRLLSAGIPSPGAAGAAAPDGIGPRHAVWRVLALVPLAFLAVLLIGHGTRPPARG